MLHPDSHWRAPDKKAKVRAVVSTLRALPSVQIGPWGGVDSAVVAAPHDVQPEAVLLAMMSSPQPRVKILEVKDGWDAQAAPPPPEDDELPVVEEPVVDEYAYCNPWFHDLGEEGEEGSDASFGDVQRVRPASVPKAEGMTDTEVSALRDLLANLTEVRTEGVDASEGSASNSLAGSPTRTSTVARTATPPSRARAAKLYANAAASSSHAHPAMVTEALAQDVFEQGSTSASELLLLDARAKSYQALGLSIPRSHEHVSTAAAAAEAAASMAAEAAACMRTVAAADADAVRQVGSSNGHSPTTGGSSPAATPPHELPRLHDPPSHVAMAACGSPRQSDGVSSSNPLIGAASARKGQPAHGYHDRGLVLAPSKALLDATPVKPTSAPDTVPSSREESRVSQRGSSSTVKSTLQLLGASDPPLAGQRLRVADAPEGPVDAPAPQPVVYRTQLALGSGGHAPGPSGGAPGRQQRVAPPAASSSWRAAAQHRGASPPEDVSEGSFRCLPALTTVYSTSSMHAVDVSEPPAQQPPAPLHARVGINGAIGYAPPYAPPNAPSGTGTARDARDSRVAMHGATSRVKPPVAHNYSNRPPAAVAAACAAANAAAAGIAPRGVGVVARSRILMGPEGSCAGGDPAGGSSRPLAAEVSARGTRAHAPPARSRPVPGAGSGKAVTGSAAAAAASIGANARMAKQLEAAVEKGARRAALAAASSQRSQRTLAMQQAGAAGAAVAPSSIYADVNVPMPVAISRAAPAQISGAATGVAVSNALERSLLGGGRRGPRF